MKTQALATPAALASPVIWFASHGAQFALAPLSCAWHSNGILWLVSALAVLLDLGSGLVAWTEWKQDSPAMPKWLALSGVVLSGAFCFVIIAQSIPSLLLPGCE